MVERGGLREKENVETALQNAHSISQLNELGYNNVMSTRFYDNGPLTLLATNTDIDLTRASRDDILRRIGDGSIRVYKLDERTYSLSYVSRGSIGEVGIEIVGPFAQGARAEEREERLQNYRNSIQSAIDAGDVALAVERGIVQWQYADMQLAQQMGTAFKEMLGFGIDEVQGNSRDAIVAFLERRGIETRVARAEVREEPRVAEIPLTPQQQTALAGYRNDVQSALDSGDTQLAYMRGLAQWKYESNSNLAGAKAAAFQEMTGLTLQEARSRLPPGTVI